MQRAVMQVIQCLCVAAQASKLMIGVQSQIRSPSGPRNNSV